MKRSFFPSKRLVFFVSLDGFLPLISQPPNVKSHRICSKNQCPQASVSPTAIRNSALRLLSTGSGPTKVGQFRKPPYNFAGIIESDKTFSLSNSARSSILPALPIPIEAEIALLVKRDKHAFEKITGAYQRELERHCYRMMGSLQDAEDLVQETFMRAMGASGNLSPTILFSGMALQNCDPCLSRRTR